MKRKAALLLAACFAFTLSAQEFELKFDKANKANWAKITNYRDRNTVQNKAVPGADMATVVSGKDLDEKSQDTSFLLVTPNVNVAGKKTLTLECSVFSTVNFRVGRGSCSVSWLDAAGKALPGTHFLLLWKKDAFCDTKLDFPVPAGAVSASVSLGYDQPNFVGTKTYFAVRSCKISVK